ncbi:MAG: phosphatase PAP2 family protein, partial [Pseudonocardia sp.]|nr:phosphatase PAP2 family protein [Pseudonocardia sp.]
RTTAVAVAVVGIAAIGGSRLYLGVHWATDVATGWLLGGTWLAVCVTALVLLHARSPRPRS